MQVLLTTEAFRHFGGRLDRSGVQWLTMDADGSLTDADGASMAWEDARPEVAWGTSDLFAAGGGLRPFFKLLTVLPSLRWFQSFAAGYDAPVFGELATRGVRITNAHVNSIPIAEFVLRSVFDEFQAAGAWRSQGSDRGWSTHDWREVYGTTWLVIGLGGIGSAVAVRARACGARVIGCRRTPSGEDPTDRTVTPDHLHEVVGEADVVVLAAPAKPETEDLVDATFLELMKQDSVLVNVARGQLVDEQALLEALDRGRPATAILDVFRTEPLPTDHPFWSHPSVRVTPHNAAGGAGRLERQADLFEENLGRYLDERPLVNDITDDVARNPG